MGAKTKIDWCDATWNPVTGCLHGCEYCYARNIAYRFGAVGWETNTENGRDGDFYDGTGENHVLDKPAMREWKSGKITKAPYPFCFDPTFHRYKLDEPQHWKKPRTIFVCSMADPSGEWVPDEWIEEVFRACEKAPQHRYLFLTKSPARLCKMASAGVLPRHNNWWFGSTLDSKNAKRFQGGFVYNTFVSVEPLTEHMHVGLGSFGSDEWVIIGAETGNRKGKIIPKREWVENIVEAAQITGMKVFMKESLRGLMGEDFRQEFPWEVSSK